VLRKIGGVVGSVVAWFLIAGAGNLVLRTEWPGYSQAEAAVTFTPGMLIARLFIAAISSLCAGFLAAWITNRSVLAMKFLAGVLLIMFLPVITLWERFPPWYHLFFLTSLPALTLLGGWLYPRRGSQRRSMNSA
jgi:hypothetical protein